MILNLELIGIFNFRLFLISLPLCFSSLSFFVFPFCAAKNWENGLTKGKTYDFEFIKKSCYWYFLNWTIMKVYVICYANAEVPNLGKIQFQWIGLKYFQPIWLHDFKSAISSQKSWWNNLVFCMLMQIYEKFMEEFFS